MVVKGCKNVVEKCCKSPGKLTKKQAEVLYLLTHEGLNEAQVAVRRQTSQQAINRIKQALIKKGYNLHDGCENTPPVSMEGFKNHKIITKLWRFHALHFVIKPYYFYARYHRIRTEKGNWGINWREWTLKLHPDMVEVQLRPLEDFSDPDKWASVSKAEASLNRTLFEASNRFGFMVYKDGKANVKLVNQNLAQNPSELSKASKSFIQVRGRDSRIWFQIDKSKGWEHEYTHSDRALTDSEHIEPYLNDMLYNDPPTLSQLATMLESIVGLHRETAEGLRAVVRILRPREYAELPKGPPDYIG